MAARDEQAAAGGIDRREAIRRAALLAGVVVSPRWLAAVEGRPLATVQAQAPARYLTPAQFALVTAIAERILPRTDTPGATDVGVPAFIDLLYGEFMTDAERELLTGGLAAVEAAAASTHKAPFPSLGPGRQDSLLREIAEAEEGRDTGSFRLMRAATVLGYFTSEPVGRSVLHYDPVPGGYESCVPIDDVGRRNYTT
jgi:gluconate 2-dehydrogenase gamma chain